MKNLQKAIAGFLCATVLLSATPNTLMVSAASKNTVKTSISKVESKAKAFKVTWKKKSKIKGYQIQYSTSSKFKKAKTKTITNSKTTSTTISKLKGCNAKYYVRVRTYKISNGKKVYSSWSKAEKITTLNHKYIKATCTKAKTCKYCDKTSGKALGHSWRAATDTMPKTCTKCGVSKGSPLVAQNTENYHGHVYTGGSSSKRYHYEPYCAGKNSHEITWNEVSQRGLTPCGTCVNK